MILTIMTMTMKVIAKRMREKKIDYENVGLNDNENNGENATRSKDERECGVVPLMKAEKRKREIRVLMGKTAESIEDTERRQ